MKVLLRAFILSLPLALALIAFNGCHKELFSAHGSLSFSTDTLTFDTVFTSLGSTTRSFTIRNTQSKAINISSIKLQGLSGTQFRININGLSGTQFSNIVIPAKDSIYAFVEVTVNPNNATNPFIIYDAVQFVTNGVSQNVTLEAMGQNAYYYFSYHVSRGTTLTMKTDKPNIIVNQNGGLPFLAVDSLATLIIPPRCQIFMGPGAVITVDGTLQAYGGDWSDSIVFQYIRRDYQNQPGLWLGITTSRIAHVSMDHVIIDQSTFGLADEYVLDLLAQQQITTSNILTYTSSPTPVDSLYDVIIRNSSSSCLTALDATVVATNCLFYACGGYLATVGFGGNYTFNDCTLANCYSSAQNSQNQVLTILDWINPPAFLGSSVALGPLSTTVNVTNSIVAGNTVQNELLFGLAQASGDHISFNNCFVSEARDSFNFYQAININGIDTTGDPQTAMYPPLFYQPFSNNYMPDSASIVVGKGSDLALADIFGYPRSSNPCIGAVQWHH